MKKNMSGAFFGVLMLVVFLPFPANADLLTFDDLPAIVGGDLIPDGYGGMNWSSFGYLDADYLAPSGYQNGVVSLRHIALNWMAAPASFSSDTPFTLGTAYMTAAWRDSLNVDIVGYNGASQTYSTTIMLNADSPSLITFDWSNLTSVTFNSYGGVSAGFEGSGTHFVLDDLVVLFSSLIEEGFSELHTSVPMVAFNMVDSFQSTASGRMLHLRQSGHEALAIADPLDGLMLASAGDVTGIGPITGDGERSKNFWGKLYGVTGDVDGDDTVAGYDYSLGGFVLGVDFKACEGAYLGLLAGVSSGRADTDLSDDFDVTSYQVGLYSSYENGPYYLDGIVTYAQSDYETSRATAMGTAEGNYDGDEWGASVEFGYVMSKDNVIFEPYLGTHYIFVDQDAFDEQGAGSMNMSVESRDSYSWKAIVGGKISGVLEQKSGAVFIPELKVAFKHEFGDDRDVVTANFVTSPAASSFVFEGLKHKRDSIELGVGARMLQANNVDMDLDLVTEFNGDEQTYTASVGLKYTW